MAPVGTLDVCQMDAGSYCSPSNEQHTHVLPQQQLRRVP